MPVLFDDDYGFAPASGFPENDYGEPEDSGDTYLTRAELEEQVAWTTANAKRRLLEAENAEMLVGE